MTHLLLIIIYMAFVSLGLPDALLGSAWPTMYMEFDVPLSYAGVVSMIIAVGTIISSLMSDRLTRVMSAGKLTAISVAMTAVGLFGFSLSGSFWMLCLWAIPYGLGAGSVDATLNNYVALHYESRHMSWLHCMWGLGAMIGPYIMGLALTDNLGWNMGYRYIAILQAALTLILIISFPMWKFKKTKTTDGIVNEDKVLSFGEIVKIPGAKSVMTCFFCYCALEQTAGLWASSYLNLYKGVETELAASFGSLFFIGITVGRALSGFLTIKFTDVQMVRAGFGIIAVGVAAMLLPVGHVLSLAGLLLIGFGCAPIYPCLIHSAPVHFGAERSQAIIGMQVASAYVGICLMPPLFGLIAKNITVALLPVYLLSMLVLMAAAHELLLKNARGGND